MADDHHHAPGLPEIHDEAADTPMWLPLLGLALFTLAALVLIIRAAVADASAELGAEAAAVEAPAEVVEAAE